MRKTLGSLILTIGLLFGWGATFIHLTQLSFLQPGRLGQATSQLVQNSAVRSAMAGALGTALLPLFGGNTVISQAQLDQIITKALANPQVDAEFQSAMNTAQGHLIGVNTGPITLGGAAFSQEIAAQVAPYSPQVAQTIAQQGLAINIPGSALPNLGGYAKAAGKLERLFIALAALMLILSLIIHPSPGAVLRKVGMWLIGTSAIDAIVFWFVPSYILPQVAFSWAQITSAVLRTAGGPATTFYVALFAAGAIVLVLGEGVKKLS
ncbi:hypothetical protein SAMN02745225_01428 [Ferrithrix thermotolerans DSM 19514]|jgi:hypothetical protein|uniref:Uncharacterized protein n=1 Tax=Ferrithrix thermotolerans DSM 19514 TaxID=1121881 RepID=A0A1M4VTR5_9ACTN|nr:hypothetical protein [Ferrithrix thermotolerans]SHE72277.1 hypothetical protein SAMN02745225_01428 [Ferrithrix thermotolerans DSM 19514]